MAGSAGARQYLTITLEIKRSRGLPTNGVSQSKSPPLFATGWLSGGKKPEISCRANLPAPSFPASSGPLRRTLPGGQSAGACPRSYGDRSRAGVPREYGSVCFRARSSEHPPLWTHHRPPSQKLQVFSLDLGANPRLLSLTLILFKALKHWKF